MKLNTQILKGLKQAQENIMVPAKWNSHQSMIDDIANILKLDKNIIEEFLIGVAFGFNSSVEPADVVKALKNNTMDWSNEYKLAVFPEATMDFIFKDNGKLYKQIIKIIADKNNKIKANDVLRRATSFEDSLHLMVKVFIIICWNLIIDQYKELGE